MENDVTIPCKFCSRPTTHLGTKMCDPCDQLRSCLNYARSTDRMKVVDEMIKLLKDGEL